MHTYNRGTMVSYNLPQKCYEKNLFFQHFISYISTTVNKESPVTLTKLVLRLFIVSVDINNKLLAVYFIVKEYF